MIKKLILPLLIIFVSLFTGYQYYNSKSTSKNFSNNDTANNFTSKNTSEPIQNTTQPTTSKENSLNKKVAGNNTYENNVTPTYIPESTKNPEKPAVSEETPIITKELNNDTPNSTENQIDTKTTPKHVENTGTETSERKVESNINNKTNIAPSSKKIITTDAFISRLKSKSYVLKQGETLSQIARKYENTCNPNTTIKLIKSVNKLNDVDNLNSGTTLLIPEQTIKTGKMYPITTGETWYGIAQKYYSEYDVNSITKLLVYINALPNNDLPLGESIFLPLLES